MRLVTKTVLAAKYGCSERTIDRYLARGLDLGRVKIGGKAMFDEEKANAALLTATAVTEAEAHG